MHHTSDTEAPDEDEIAGDDETSTQNADDQDHDDLYIAYLTGKIRTEGGKGKNFDPEAVCRTAEDRIKAAKAKSFCSARGQRGHWHRDPVCPRRRGDHAGTGSRDEGRKAQTVHVVNEIYEVASDITGGLMAITDSACSKNVMGTGWLQKYLDMMRGRDFNPDFVHEREAFRFGASRVYESSYAAVILIALGGKWIAIKAAVVHGDVPLLLSRPCLAHLGMVLDVEKNTADFRAINVRNFALQNTSTGHPAIPVSHQGLTLPCVNNLPKAWRDEGVEILNPRVVYMTGTAGTGGVQGLAGPQYTESNIDDPHVQGYPKIFFDKKIDEATKKMLTGDSLNLNTFLCWWNSTNISNDFWIEGPETLVRVHVIPRRTFFDPSKWRTTYSNQRTLLLENLGDLRETWGIACCTQRELTTVTNQWRHTSETGHHVLWIGRSVFNRAVRTTCPPPRCHEPGGAMEAQQERVGSRAGQAQHHGEPSLDRARASSCIVAGAEGQEGHGQSPEGDREHEPLGAPERSFPSGDLVHREGHEGFAHPPHPRHHLPRRDADDAGSVPRNHVQGHPQGLRQLDGEGDGSQPGQHAPRPASLCALASGPDEGGSPRLLVPRQSSRPVRDRGEDSSATRVGDRILSELDGDSWRRHPEGSRDYQTEIRAYVDRDLQRREGHPSQGHGRRSDSADPPEGAGYRPTSDRSNDPYNDKNGSRRARGREAGDSGTRDTPGTPARCLGTFPRTMNPHILDNPDDEFFDVEDGGDAILPEPGSQTLQESPDHTSQEYDKANFQDFNGDQTELYPQASFHSTNQEYDEANTQDFNGDQTELYPQASSHSTSQEYDEANTQDFNGDQTEPYPQVKPFGTSQEYDKANLQDFNGDQTELYPQAGHGTDFDHNNGHYGEPLRQDSSSHDMHYEHHASELPRTTYSFAEESPGDHLNAENHTDSFLSNHEVRNLTFPLPSSEAFLAEKAGRPPEGPGPRDGESVAKKHLLANMLRVEDLERVLQAQRLPSARGTRNSAHPTGAFRRHVLGYYAYGG